MVKGLHSSHGVHFVNRLHEVAVGWWLLCSLIKLSSAASSVSCTGRPALTGLLALQHVPLLTFGLTVNFSFQLCMAQALSEHSVGRNKEPALPCERALSNNCSLETAPGCISAQSQRGFMRKLCFLKRGFHCVAQEPHSPSPSGTLDVYHPD